MGSEAQSPDWSLAALLRTSGTWRESQEAAARLWRISEQLTGVAYDLPGKAAPYCGYAEW